MWEITLPRTIILGEGALDYLEELKGRRALIITDKTMHSLGVLDQVAKRLEKAGLEVAVFDEVEPEPSKGTVRRAAQVAHEFGPDWIIGLGGGSCMDVAKAVFVLYERPDVALEEISPLVELGLRKKAKLLNIPTTSGTGADVTWAIVITNEAEGRKMELASREVVADITILDPALPSTMPPRLTADTAIDALTHAIEAYVSKWHNDFSDALALWAIRAVFRYLPRAYENGQDMEARKKLHNAATMAGLAFSNSQIGLAHAMGHALGALFKVPHGRTVAVFLPYTIEYNAREPNATNRYAEIAEALGFGPAPPEELVTKLVEAVRGLLQRVNGPLKVADLGIDKRDYEARLDTLVDRAMESTGLVANPREPSRDDLARLFTYAYEGRPVDF